MATLKQDENEPRTSAKSGCVCRERRTRKDMKTTTGLRVGNEDKNMDTTILVLGFQGYCVHSSLSY